MVRAHHRRRSTRYYARTKSRWWKRQLRVPKEVRLASIRLRPCIASERRKWMPHCNTAAEREAWATHPHLRCTTSINMSVVTAAAPVATASNTANLLELAIIHTTNFGMRHCAVDRSCHIPQGQTTLSRPVNTCTVTEDTPSGRIQGVCPVHSHSSQVNRRREGADCIRSTDPLFGVSHHSSGVSPCASRNCTHSSQFFSTASYTFSQSRHVLVPLSRSRSKSLSSKSPGSSVTSASHSVHCLR